MVPHAAAHGGHAREMPDPLPETTHGADLRLVHGALQGRAADLEALVDRLGCLPAMLRRRNRQLGQPFSEDELADVEHDVLAALWAKLSRFDGRSSLETWVYGFAMIEIHKSLDRRRKGPVFDRLDDHAPQTATERDDPPLERGQLLALLERLGSDAGDVVRLHYYDDLTLEEIARRLGVSSGTVKSRYYRALLRLRDLLKPSWKRMRE